MFAEALSLPFFEHALLAGSLASVACGVIGTYVVVKQMASISGGLSHAAFGGVGLGYLLGFSPMLGAVGFCLVSAMIIGVVYRRQRSNLDTLISMVWSVGMALGILFISLSPNYAPELTSYLFGSILFVPRDYLVLVAILDIVIIAVVVLLYKEFQAVAFDEEFSEVQGVPVEPVFLILLGLSALAVVTLIKVVGVILTIALLTTPAVIARHWVHNLGRMMWISTLICMVCTTAGLFLSYYLSSAYRINAPTGPLIILLVVTLFSVSLTARNLRGRN